MRETAAESDGQISSSSKPSVAMAKQKVNASSIQQASATLVMGDRESKDILEMLTQHLLLDLRKKYTTIM